MGDNGGGIATEDVNAQQLCTYPYAIVRSRTQRLHPLAGQGLFALLVLEINDGDGIGLEKVGRGVDIGHALIRSYPDPARRILHQVKDKLGTKRVAVLVDPFASDHRLVVRGVKGRTLIVHEEDAGVEAGGSDPFPLRIPPVDDESCRCVQLDIGHLGCQVQGVPCAVHVQALQLAVGTRVQHP